MGIYGLCQTLKLKVLIGTFSLLGPFLIPFLSYVPGDTKKTPPDYSAPQATVFMIN